MQWEVSLFIMWIHATYLDHWNEAKCESRRSSMDALCHPWSRLCVYLCFNRWLFMPLVIIGPLHGECHGGMKVLKRQNGLKRYPSNSQVYSMSEKATEAESQWCNNLPVIKLLITLRNLLQTVCASGEWGFWCWWMVYIDWWIWEIAGWCSVVLEMVGTLLRSWCIYQ